MEDERWTTSPEQYSQTKNVLNGMNEDKDEYGLALDDIDADIYLDESTRENPLYALNGHSSSAVMNGTGEGTTSQKLGDRWSSNSSKPAAMTLKEQEKIIEEVKSENFGLKLRVFFLEERLEKMSPEHMNGMAQENVDLKANLQRILSELRQYKELLTRARATIASLEAQANCELQHGMTEEQEEEFRNAIAERLELIAKVKQLTQRIEAMEQEANAKDSELLQLRSRLGELDAQLEDTEELKASYEDQIRELQDQLMEYQQNESRLYERPREDEGWKVQCHELEQELAASQEELLQARSEMNAMNRYMEQQKDELSKARMDAAKLSRQLEGERDHRPYSQVDIDLEELRKLYEQLEAHCHELVALRKEDAIRHDQQLEDIVAELDDRTAELAQTQEDLRNARHMLHSKDKAIAVLEEQIKQLGLSLQDIEAIHEEEMAKMKAQLQSGFAASLRTETIPLRDFQQIREDLERSEQRYLKIREDLELTDQRNLKLGGDLELSEQRNIKLCNDLDLNEQRNMKLCNDLDQSEQRNLRLESKLRMANEQRMAAETLGAEASEQIAELTNELNDRDDRLRFYEEQESHLSKDTEARLKLNSDLEDLLQVIERNKAAIIDKNDQIDNQAREMDTQSRENSRLNIKIRKLNDANAALEEEKEQLETELRDRATTVAMLRSRLTELELQLSKKQRDDQSAGETSKGDLGERNTLLFTILQHLENILGDDDRLEGNMLPKPSNNFDHFSSHVLSRLKSLSGLFVLFERQAKELENKTLVKLNQFKKQMNMRLMQLEEYETTINKAIERQKKLRSQLAKKQTENEELQAKQLLLARTIAELKGRAKSSDRSRDVEARYRQLELKLQAERTQYVKSEELWNARIRELEKRTKNAEEGRQRDRQGYKEKLAALHDANEADRKTVDGLLLQNAYQQEIINSRSQTIDTPKRSNTPSGSRLERGSLNLDQLWNRIDHLSKSVDREKSKNVQRDEAIKNALSRMSGYLDRRLLDQVADILYEELEQVE